MFAKCAAGAGAGNLYQKKRRKVALVSGNALPGEEMSDFTIGSQEEAGTVVIWC